MNEIQLTELFRQALRLSLGVPLLAGMVACGGKTTTDGTGPRAPDAGSLDTGPPRRGPPVCRPDARYECVGGQLICGCDPPFEAGVPEASPPIDAGFDVPEGSVPPFDGSTVDVITTFDAPFDVGSDGSGSGACPASCPTGQTIVSYDDSAPGLPGPSGCDCKPDPCPDAGTGCECTAACEQFGHGDCCNWAGTTLSCNECG